MWSLADCPSFEGGEARESSSSLSRPVACPKMAETIIIWRPGFLRRLWCDGPARYCGVGSPDEQGGMRSCREGTTIWPGPQPMCRTVSFARDVCGEGDTALSVLSTGLALVGETRGAKMRAKWTVDGQNDLPPGDNGHEGKARMGGFLSGQNRGHRRLPFLRDTPPPCLVPCTIDSSLMQRLCEGGTEVL